MLCITNCWGNASKTMVRCHNILIRRVKIKNSNYTNANKDVEKLNHSYIAGGK